MATMQSLMLNVVILTKDQQLIQEMDSSLQSVSWDLITHKQQPRDRQEHTYYLDLNTSSRDFSDSLEKLVSLLLTMQNLNSSGLGVLGKTLELYCHTARKSESMYELEIVDGESDSKQQPSGTA